MNKHHAGTDCHRCLICAKNDQKGPHFVDGQRRLGEVKPLSGVTGSQVATQLAAHTVSFQACFPGLEGSALLPSSGAGLPFRFSAHHFQRLLSASSTGDGHTHPLPRGEALVLLAALALPDLLHGLEHLPSNATTSNRPGVSPILAPSSKYMKSFSINKHYLHFWISTKLAAAFSSFCFLLFLLKRAQQPGQKP